MSDRPPFLELCRQRIVVLDGAMGSNLQGRAFDLQRDWLGHENISEVLNLTRPEVIREIHESFLAVGCDAVETNTFGANEIVLAEADLAHRTREINRIAAGLARAACDRFHTPSRPRYVVGAIGPGTKILTLGQTTWDVMFRSYAEQVRGLLDGGVDVLLIETQQDLLAIKCCLAAIDAVFAEVGRDVPVMVQASMDQQGGKEMLTGSDATALVAALEPFDRVRVLGLNCAFGPVELTESLRHIASAWPRLVSVLPNAGLPVYVDGKAHFPMNPADFTRGMMRFVDELGVNLVGGCCGTMPEHLRELCAALDLAGNGTGRPPTPRKPQTRPQVSSLVSAVDLRQDNSYLIIAERTNTNGSRQFKRLLQEEDWDGLVSMARDEMRDGSHLLDVCVDFVGRDGVRDMHEVVRRYVNAIPAPLMLDSTSPQVMEAGLRLAGGRCILNSMNLEEGEEKLAHICRLARTYGAAVVAGCIDEDKVSAMARTAQRKLDIALRIRDLAVNKYGLRDQDLMFDPLVLPISTGIEDDRRNALETIEGTRLISRHLPDCHTVVGLSNVSFGLKPAARVVLNSVFLHELREAGLTAAIVHVSKILPKNRIPDDQWNAALDLIYDRRRDGFDPLTHFVSLFPDDGNATTTAKKSAFDDLTLEEALRRHIIDGERRDLTRRLDEALQKYPPLAIINDHLLDGMKVVGELFAKGEMQLPFVLQSAETMKAAVAYLEPFMERVEGQTRGKIVLATVKGDVHDIGKNLVDIILTNNGYTVINLGIKQPIDDILRAAREHRADAIGMSGLLVKSVAVMKENLEEMNARGVNMPVLLGGAALTRDYAEDDLASLYRGPLLYCRDAFDGLKVMDHLAEGRLAELTEAQRQRSQRRRQLRAAAARPSNADADAPAIARDNPVPIPPFWGRRVVRDVPLSHIFPFINENALFRGQWGFKPGRLSADEFEDLLEREARPVFRDLQRRAAAEGFLQPRVVYGYFPCQADGDDLIVYHIDEFKPCDCHPHLPGGCKPRSTPREHLRFTFPRQQGRRRLCIADFFRPVSSGQFDVLAVQLVTVGEHASALADALRRDNRYQDYLYLHGFGVETAEALAEYWHKRVRIELGFGFEDAPEIPKLFQQHYRGSRYSFGYPACPNLEDRKLIVELLRPEEIGVHLTENFMLDPEQSTDAVISHHPQAKYFDV